MLAMNSKAQLDLSKRVSFDATLCMFLTAVSKILHYKAVGWPAGMMKLIQNIASCMYHGN